MCLRYVRTIDRGQSSTSYQLGDGIVLSVLRVLVARCMIDVLKGLWIGYQEIFLLRVNERLAVCAFLKEDQDNDRTPTGADTRMTSPYISRHF